MRFSGRRDAVQSVLRRHMVRLVALLGVVLLPVLPAAAQGMDEALFLTNLDDLFTLDEASLFGSGGLLTEVEETAGALEEAFLVSRRVDIGGTYNLSLGSSWTWVDASGVSTDPMTKRGLDLAASAFVDVRPAKDFRAFAKVKGNADLLERPIEADVKLHELFIDYVYGERAFFRAGKQSINWGVGYFFSPADIVNVGRLDPENPEAEREGPVAVRLNLPGRRSNYYTYAIVDGKPGDVRLALAPKAEYVLGNSEVGVGLYYRADRAPRAMVTLSTSAGRFALFGEAVVSKGSDKRFVEETESPDYPLGLKVVTDKENLRFHATAGARVSYSDPDGRYSVAAAGQYYYNGEGYDGEFIKANSGKMWALWQLGELTTRDLSSTGKHYAALSVSGTSRAVRNVQPAAFWLGNLSDGSGMISLSFGYTGWKDVRASLGISRNYGALGSEFGAGKPATTLTVSLGWGGNW